MVRTAVPRRAQSLPDSRYYLFIVGREARIPLDSGVADRAMKPSSDLEQLLWLMPSLARAGLVRNGDWVLPAAAEAGAMFADQDLRLKAQVLAVLDPFALDYIRQAPVLVLAAAYRKDMLRRAHREEAAKRFIASCATGTKLSTLMRSYNLSPQLRALSAEALRYNQITLLFRLSELLPASTLAQAIPADPAGQSAWLKNIARWRDHMGRYFNDKDRLLEWAARSLSAAESTDHTIDVADYAGRERRAFNTKWSFAQALAAAHRWHAQLRMRPPPGAVKRPDWRTPIDYTPLPSLWQCGGIEFHALQTREALFEEGAHMHHCVAVYADRVAKGASRIYSLRRAGTRIATLELIRTSRKSSKVQRFRLSQLKGPHNAHPLPAASNATAAFIAAINPPKRAAGPGITIDPGRTERVVAALRRRIGKDTPLSWLTAMRLEVYDGSCVRISFASIGECRWVEAHFAGHLLACCVKEFGKVERLEFTLPGGRPPVIEDAFDRQQQA
jgi:hypothetical protein